VALVESCARHRVSARTSTVLTRIGTRARIPIVACRSIGHHGVAAKASRRAARARQVAGIEWRAGPGLTRNTGTGLACVPEGAAVAVAARSPVRLGRVGACACSGIADAGIVTLVRGRARHRVCAHAASGHAGVALRASVAVAARSAIGLGWVRAPAGYGITGSDSVALIAGAAGYRIFPCADAF
jgi:hypothetical protein